MRINIIVCGEDRISLKINQTYMEEFSLKYKVKANIQIFDQVGEEFYEYIEQNTVDIALLDTNYRNCNGIELAKLIQRSSSWVNIIFISNSEDLAFDAYSILATGFIKRPINQISLERLFARSVIQVQSIKHRRINRNIDFYYNKSKISIRQANIIFLQKINQKTKFITSNKCYETYETLSSIQSRLDQAFIRINQSIIVNMHQISSLEKDTIYLQSGAYFKIGRSYLKKVRQAYLNYSCINS